MQGIAIEEVAKKGIAAMTRRCIIRYDILTPIVCVSIKENDIELALRYLTEAKLRRTTHDALYGQSCTIS